MTRLYWNDMGKNSDQMRERSLDMPKEKFTELLRSTAR